MPADVIDEEALYKKIRESIRSIRTNEGDRQLSQTQLGKVLGIKRSTVANLETGAQKPSLHNVYALCEHFGIDLLDVLPNVQTVRKEATVESSIVIPEEGMKTNSVIAKLKARD